MVGVELFLLAEDFKVGFDGERDNGWRAVGEVVFEGVFVGCHCE